jgi:hypothetical protein
MSDTRIYQNGVHRPRIILAAIAFDDLDAVERGQVRARTSSERSVNFDADDAASRTHDGGDDGGVVAWSTPHVEDVIPRLEFEKMKPQGESARLPVVQPTTGVDRHNEVGMVQARRIARGPVPCRGTPTQATRDPLPDVRRRCAANEPRWGSEEVFPRHLRERRTQPGRQAKAVASPEDVTDLVGKQSTGRLQIFYCHPSH